MVNTKNANTFTGTKGAQGLKEVAQTLSKALTLKSSQSPKGVSDVIKMTDLIFASTGVIGEDFPYLKIKNRIPELVKKLRTGQTKYVWFKAASAIMTTDTRPKVAYEECKIGNKLIKISGIAKGSGMIAPNMATMLSFIFTDANIPSVFLRAILKKITATTFNSITIDSDTSTNDMVGIFATGKAKNLKIYNVLDPKLQDFEKALHRLCLNLAKQIVVDGEGAKKFITINVIGARSLSMAKNVSFSIANSPLFKTAIAGEDPNWGRIVMAIGKSGENIISNKIQIKIGNFLVVEQNKVAKDYNEKDVKKYMKWDSINIEVNLNIGSASFTVYTCDFTHDYIDINADYSRN
jgi:glutamate N-acetyltransferase/amino-acid N-acetyltransferase